MYVLMLTVVLFIFYTNLNYQLLKLKRKAYLFSFYCLLPSKYILEPITMRKLYQDWNRQKTEQLCTATNQLISKLN